MRQRQTGLLSGAWSVLTTHRLHRTHVQCVCVASSTFQIIVCLWGNVFVDAREWGGFALALTGIALAGIALEGVALGRDILHEALEKIAL